LRTTFATCAAVVIVTGADPAAENSVPAEKKEAPVVEQGKKVSIEYTLKLEDGTQVETNLEKEPLTYTHGEGQIISGLEEALTGMREGDAKTVTVPPEKAYGETNPQAYQEVEKGQVPEKARKEGTLLTVSDGAGNRRQVRVHEIKDDKVVIDLNHPLAGKTLKLDVKVVDVQ
jgi:FKBP-type peptidyl-prolyl cis-trans isomerase SlyD